MKRIVSASLSAFALMAAAPLTAQEDEAAVSDGETVDEDAIEFLTEEEEAIAEVEREMEEAFGLFAELFKADPLTAEQQALLPLAGKMTDVIMPKGTFGLVMQDSMEPMMTTIMSAVASDPRLRLGVLTGIDGDDLSDMEDHQAQEALDIFDPQYAERTQKMGELVVDMIRQMFDALEPAYRQAYTRALTTRFDKEEMTELLSFFDTPTGAKFASASFSIQYDPQMLGVMEQMGPAIVKVLPGMMESAAELEAKFATERKFGDLSGAERERAAALLGKSVSELEALQPEDKDETEAEDANAFEEA